MAQSLSRYELQRLANVQRNAVIMEEMGIPGMVPQELRARPSAGQAAKRRKRLAPAPEEDSRERRRSSRLANAPAVVFTTFEGLGLDEDLGDGRERRSKKATRPEGPVADDGELPQAAAPPAGLEAEGVTGGAAAPGSSKALLARVDDMAALLGKQVLPTDGSGSFKAAAMSRLRGGGAVRFNKYAGIQEWQNAVALFVNVRSKKSGSYPNIFLAGGSQMTWFAQPTQDAETPVIRRLLACRDVSAATPVVLFIREEGCAYVYAGRLTCLTYFPKASPLKLVWQLADFEALQTAPDYLALMNA